MRCATSGTSSACTGGSIGAGIGIAAFLVYMLYLIGPTRGGGADWFQLVRPADHTELRAAREEALERMRRRIADDPEEEADVEARVAEIERRAARAMRTVMPGRLRLRDLRALDRAVGGGDVDRAVVDIDDRILAHHLMTTGHPDGELFRKPADLHARGLLLSMVSLPLAVLGVWIATNVEVDPWRHAPVLTERHVAAFVEHYEAAGFEVRLPDETTSRRPGLYLREVEATRGDEVCHGDYVSGFAGMTCRDAGTSRLR